MILNERMYTYLEYKCITVSRSGRVVWLSFVTNHTDCTMNYPCAIAGVHFRYISNYHKIKHGKNKKSSVERVSSFFYGVCIKSSFITFMFQCSCILYLLWSYSIYQAARCYVHLSDWYYCTCMRNGQAGGRGDVCTNVCLCHLGLTFIGLFNSEHGARAFTSFFSFVFATQILGHS